jgi:hypothetical protein
MTLPAEQLREVPAPDGVVIARVLEGDVRTLLATAAEAFGDGPPTDAQIAAYRGRGHLARADGSRPEPRSTARSPTGSASSAASGCASAFAAAGSLER